MSLFRVSVGFDKTGRCFERTSFGRETICNLCYKDKIVSYKGCLRLTKRTGESVYGDEVIIDFLINNEEKPKEQLKHSKYNSIEAYLPKKEGLLLLKHFLNKE